MNTTLTIIAIIAGPILAVQVQKLIERITQRRDEKRRLLITLMATRGHPQRQEHVDALNMIDFIFCVKGRISSIIFWFRYKKDKAVIEAYAEYRDHLFHYPKEPAAKDGTGISKEDMTLHNAQVQTWTSKKDELFIELLDKMADSLGYHYDKVLLKRGAYTPSSYGEDLFLHYAIRRGLVKILYGRPLSVNIVELPPTAEKEPAQKVTPEEPKQEPPKEQNKAQGDK